MISFGPITSRRLGKSLGINNIFSPKVCTYGCVYCQVGKTKKYSIERQPFFETDVVFNEITAHLQKLKKEDFPDYLTFVSNGEPTLDINLGEIINKLKTMQIITPLNTRCNNGHANFVFHFWIDHRTYDNHRLVGRKFFDNVAHFFQFANRDI